MIPEKPQIITSPICYNGDKRAIPESTPLGSNQLSFESGFPVLTSTPLNAGGLPPDRQDFNAALNLLSTFIYYMQSGNQFVWSNQLDYNAGAFVIGSDNAVYFCIQANGATDPNTVQDPISSPDYWVQILNSDGKLNADALSVTLGSFAQLNSLALTDNRLTGRLPVRAGGTGADNADDARTNLQAMQFYIAKTGVNNDLNNITNTCVIRFNGNAVNGPGSTWGHALCYYHRDNNKYQIYITWNGDQYMRICQGSSSGSTDYGPWIKILNANGTIPSTSFADNSISGDAIVSLAASKVSGLATVAKTGSYNDLLNKPTIPTDVAPLPTSSSWVCIGSNGQGSKYIVPDGGSWAICVFGMVDGGSIPINIPNNPQVGVFAGGTVLYVNGIIGVVGVGGFGWRIQ